MKNVYDIKRYVAGPLETNGYMLINNKEVLILDPSFNSVELLTDIANEGYEIAAVVLTHGHFDHFLGILEILDAYPQVPVYLHPDDTFLLTDPDKSGAAMLDSSLVYYGKLHPIAEGTLEIGSFTLEVYHVPGHTPGGVALYDGTNLFSGDILFADSVGRSDFVYGNGEELIEGIKEKLLKLPDDTVVCPGHGMRTTIGRERRANLFLI